ncbi:MAG: hypothetical protein NTX87_06610 [Planctomycetota bacterium]|nr:hypothetical protein [Planctomycetota bacterium]
MEPPLKRGRRQISLTDVESTIESARSRAEELLEAVRSLPVVDEEGNSECPFAEELYAKKEKLQAEVEGLFRRLHECKADVEYLIENCKRNLVVVSANEDMLNGDRARAMFSEAEAALAARYKACLLLRDRIVETIRFVDKVLREAVVKRYPGKIPEEWPGTEFSRPATDQNQHLASERSGADKELDDLFQLDYERRAANSRNSNDDS